MTDNKMSKIEDKIKALEKVVQELESGQLSIDDAIESYSKAMDLSSECKKQLDAMTQKIEIARSKHNIDNDNN